MHERIIGMLDILIILLLLSIAYLLWSIRESLTETLFRLSEMQRDIAYVRRASKADENDSELDSV